jgi:hypothetical protein
VTSAIGIDRFIRRVTRQQRRGRALAILRNHGLVLLALLLLVEIMRPSALLLAACVAAFWLAAGVLISLTGRVQILVPDEQFGLQDELATWTGTSAGQRETAMFSWLARQLETRIVAMPLSLTRKISRAPLGRLRYLLPLLILLLLLRLFAPVLPPLPEGRLALSNQGGAGVAGAGAESGAGGDQGEADEGEAEKDPEAPPSEDEPQPEEQQEEAGEENPPELPPKALDNAAGKDESFLLPSFVGEGESRLTKAPVAGIDEQGAGGAAGEQAKSTAGRGMDELDEKDFERALEKALRSRHVPESERPFVRRYFEALMRRGR